MKQSLRPIKSLGQHFLNDDTIARDIAYAIPDDGSFEQIWEIGPGMGVLTHHLLERFQNRLLVIEIDTRSVQYLYEHFPLLASRIHEVDFLQYDPSTLGRGPVAVTGNFPYNISSQILFKILEFHERVPYLAGMFQKEVAERIASGPGNKDYGILSVLLQVHYDIEYLFTVPAHVFTPPPKVLSGVIRMKHKATSGLQSDPVKFKRVVKTAFNQRRKVLRNSLSSINPDKLEIPFALLRPEQLTWQQFDELTLFFTTTGTV